MTLEAIKFDGRGRRLEILDQLKLPHETVYVDINSTEAAHDAIKRMVTRGAPAIAIVGALAVAIDLWAISERGELDLSGLKALVEEKLDYIVTSRPTAVNLTRAAADIRKRVQTSGAKLPTELAQEILNFAEGMLEADIADNKAIGANGSGWIRKHCGEHLAALTICNTGSLATAGYGTALGIVRSLYADGALEHVYALETRPYNQGARLTAYELVHDKLPATLITDSMAAALMSRNPNVKVAISGADRVALNGDTANKIGTYQLAVLAKFHGVKVVMAVPTTSIDFSMETGADIKIEERPAKELTSVQGVEVAAPGIDVWNPAFDVTPASLIDAIVTEKGVVEKIDGRFDLRSLKDQD